MRMQRKDLAVLSAVVCAAAIPLLVATLALGQSGGILVQNFQCTDPIDNNFCQMNIENPCAKVPGPCFDWTRWFSNVIDCDEDANLRVASGANGNSNGGYWYGCQGGTIPGSTCQYGYSVCGTVDTYSGANCQVATYCGNVNMSACNGSCAVGCAGGTVKK